MANITANDDVSVFKIQKFLGLNESPDGDTQLKLGEASELRNWQITPQYHLRVRPGYRTIHEFEGPIRGMWTGYVAGVQKTICAADGGIWEIGEAAQGITDCHVASLLAMTDGGRIATPPAAARNDSISSAVAMTDGRRIATPPAAARNDSISSAVAMTNTIRKIGDIWDAPTTMFGFGNKVYFLNGQEYLVWDGEGYVDAVEGYVPLTVTAMAPGGGGTTVENINRLTGKRRVQFSADGEATEYHLPETGLLSIEKVLNGTEELAAGWTADLTTGVITFEEAPAAGNSNIEVRYTMPNTLRSLVEGMRYAEQFNGAADTRVFLYGDGTAKAIYCGVTEDGQASAEYFPDLYEIIIGAENAPITGMIKYYDRLMSYKADGGAYATKYEAVTLADGSVIPGFQTVAINRDIGNHAMGQVRLVKNVPRTLYSGNLYDWVMVNYGTRDERNAKLISQRVQNTLRQAKPGRIFCFDDDTKQEYYLFLNDKAGTALVHSYQTDTWCCYTALPVVCAVRRETELLFGLSDGRLVVFHEKYPNDDGKAIAACYASGYMDFGRDDLRKHSAVTWVSIKPTANANLEVTARSDRRSSYGDRDVTMSLSTFRQADFSRWSFLTSRSPKIRRLKLKMKKFVFYQLILKSDYYASDATVLGVDMQVRYGRQAK